tara:strand:+ start:316 stop:651 length:336 start_codon:yes stop_codon:yes gene_type:complete
MLNIISILAFIFFGLIYLHISKCIDSQKKTETFWSRFQKWQDIISGKLNDSYESELENLLRSDTSDLEKLMVRKMSADDEKRVELADRKDAIPGKVAESIARASVAYKLNK